MSTMLADANRTIANGSGIAEWALLGPTGVTGRMLLERALAAGHRPLLLGRSSPQLFALAEAKDLPFSAVALEDAGSLKLAFAGLRLVVNAAGPFSLTTKPTINAALAAGIDYLDLNGELNPLVDLLALKVSATSAKVALVGGCGFGIAASDGLAVIASELVGGAETLRLSVAADSGFSSPAVAESTLTVIEGGGREIHDGRLVRRRLGAIRWTKSLAGKDVAFASAPLADLAAAQHVTGAPSIVAGVPMPSAQAIGLSAVAPLLPRMMRLGFVRRAMANIGSHAAADNATTSRTSRVIVEAMRGKRRAAATLVAGEAFAVAVDITLAAIDQILETRPTPGAHTPATAFGPHFLQSVSGVEVHTSVEEIG